MYVGTGVGEASGSGASVGAAVAAGAVVASGAVVAAGAGPAVASGSSAPPQATKNMLISSKTDIRKATWRTLAFNIWNFPNI